MTVELVLASASPARLATLRATGIEPRVIVSEVDEPAAVARAADALGARPAADATALLLARAKSEAVSAAHSPDALVLGCDSVLEFDGETFGKPSHAQEATERWQRMRGRSGTLHTGHWLIDDRAESTGGTFGTVASTVVHFAQLTDAELAAYVATGEPMQVAGGFTIDGLGGPYVERIEGDHHNVVGLSLPVLRQMLAEIGVRIEELRA